MLIMQQCSSKVDYNYKLKFETIFSHTLTLSTELTEHLKFELLK